MKLSRRFYVLRPALVLEFVSQDFLSYNLCFPILYILSILSILILLILLILSVSPRVSGVNPPYVPGALP